MQHEHATLQSFRTAFNVASLPTTCKTCKDVLGTASHVFKVESGWMMFTRWRRDLFLAPPALLIGCDARLPLRQWRPWQRSKAPACTAYGKSWPRRGGRRRHIVRNPPVVPKYTTIPSKWVFLKKGSPKSIGQSRLDH